ncbi:sodium transport ATPase [Dipodascopsis uninucleata]
MVDTSSSSEANDPGESLSGICGETTELDESVDEPPPFAELNEKQAYKVSENNVEYSDKYGAKSNSKNASNISAPPHVVSPSDLADRLQSSLETGLSQAEASSRLATHGKNVLESEGAVSIFSILIRQISNSLTLILILAMALSYGTSDWIEGGVITAVILLNITIGFFQDFNAEKTMKSLLSLSAPMASVVRDGQILKIQSHDIVVGDIVQIKIGDVVPADIRLFESMNLECDEALLTGESMAVSKSILTLNEPSLSVGDRINVCYTSSTVSKGRGTGIVFATGMHTEIGKIAQMLKSDSDIVTDDDSSSSLSVKRKTLLDRLGSVKMWFKATLGLIGTPLQVKLSKFAIVLFALALLLAIIVFSVSKWKVDDNVLIYGICVAVAVIPESLVAVLTITLSVATKAMAEGHVLVRKMQALEALGGVTDICSDKTGTLTQGKMITRCVWVPSIKDMSFIEVQDSSEPFSPESGYLQTVGMKVVAHDILVNEQVKSSLFKQFLNGIGLCNLASVTKRRIDSTDEGKWTAVGEPTEISLQVFAMRFENGRSELEDQGWELINEHPFDSSIKRMSVVYRSPDKKYFAFIKGAIESVAATLATNDYSYENTHFRVEEMTRSGLRVLSVAYRTFEDTSKIDFSSREAVETDMRFLGLCGLYDPPRVETRGAVLKAQQAGIKVHMLTGDHPGTAKAIAYETGILSPNMAIASLPHTVMIASEFDAMSEQHIDTLPELPLVVARCAPSTKVRMVEALHRRQAFCVMTGDGVNDSPALKRADVGIAMGLNGSDVAKDASDMILTDDDFASIVRAIEEGRRLFDNIQKFLVHLLVSNISQIILLLCGLAFKDRSGVSVFPLSPLEILWANMITSSFLAMGLGVEEAQPDIMQRPPHDLKVGVFTWEVIVDKMIYGCTMGVLCLASFITVVYGANNGNLGDRCNYEYNDSCYAIFKARATAFSVLSFLLLITAWEVKHFARSLFCLDPHGFPGPFSVFPALYHNKFLFYAVVGGFVGTFPVLYIPIINKVVFKHLGLSWEWGIVACACVLYTVVVEVWKAIKRRLSLWSGKLVPVNHDIELNKSIATIGEPNQMAIAYSSSSSSTDDSLAYRTYTSDKHVSKCAVVKRPASAKIRSVST